MGLGLVWATITAQSLALNGVEGAILKAELCLGWQHVHLLRDHWNVDDMPSSIFTCEGQIYNRFTLIEHSHSV